MSGIISPTNISMFTGNNVVHPNGSLSNIQSPVNGHSLSVVRSSGHNLIGGGGGGIGGLNVEGGGVNSNIIGHRSPTIARWSSSSSSTTSSSTTPTISTVGLGTQGGGNNNNGSVYVSIDETFDYNVMAGLMGSSSMVGHPDMDPPPGIIGVEGTPSNRYFPTSSMCSQ